MRRVGGAKYGLYNDHDVTSRFIRQVMTLTDAHRRSLVVPAAVLLILCLALLHSQAYRARNYREDEVGIVYQSHTYSTVKLVQYLGSSNIHPPGWRLLAKLWIAAFGDNENITRWPAALGNLVTFALIYQLGKHIGGRRAGLYAIFLLGMYGFAGSLMNELRPYPMLITLTTALHLLFFRWMRKPSSVLMFAYVFAGVAAIYTHYFALFIFPAHAVMLALFTRYQRKLWLDSVLMWLFIGLSFVGWLLPFLHSILVREPGGVTYSFVAAGANVWEYFESTSFAPAIIYQWLMLLSPLTAWKLRPFGTASGRLRIAGQFAGFLPVILLAALVLIAIGSDHLVGSFSVRNAVMFAPLIAVCMALGLRLLPDAAALILMALLLIHAPQNMEVQTTAAPYREIVQEMGASYHEDSIVVTEFHWARRWLLAAVHYLMYFTPDHIAPDRMFHIVDPFDGPHPIIYDDGPVNLYNWIHPEVFDSGLPTHEQLWHLSEGGGNVIGADFEAWLKQHYALVRTQAWDEPYVTEYALSEYARAPQHDGPILLAGDSLQLYAWELEGSVEVEACQSVMVESWWQLKAGVDVSYSLGIILAEADGDGQVAIQDSIPAEKFTSEWQAERFYRDRTSLQIPCTIEDGRYNLLLAAKETTSGAILPLRNPDGNEIENEYYLTTLHVSAR